MPAIVSHKYEINVFWSEQDSTFVAKVPELPGCMADGATYVEAVVNVEVIIAEWIETAKEIGRSIPVPQQKFAVA